MSDEEDFPDCEPQRPQDSPASPQNNAAQEAGLHVAKATDLRDFEDWANDEGFCQRFLMDKPATWRKAVERYWRDRCNRKELTAELGLDLETVKNLLRRIRKAVSDEQSGKKRKPTTEVQWARRCHSEINAADIHAICDGDPEAIAHMEEYGRLNVIERLRMFSPAIADDLIRTLEHFETNKQNQAITSGLLAKAEKLKPKDVKPDPFLDRPMIAFFADDRTRMKIPETGENGVTKWKARTIGQSEAEPVGRGRPRKEKPAQVRKRGRPCKQVIPDVSDLRIMPIPPPIFLDKRNPQHLEERMQYQQAAEIIKQHNIPRSTVARLSGLYLSDLSGWLNGRTDLSQDKIERVSIAVADIARMVEAMKTLSIGVDLTDCENVRLLVQKINDAEMQMDLALDGQPVLRMEPIEPGMEAAN